MNETSPDADSQPSSAATNCTPTQDDEAVWTINLGQSGQAVSPLSNENQGTETADFTIFPNPTDCVVQIELKNQQVVPIKVYSIDGKQVLSTQLDFTNERAILDLSELPVGPYIIKGEDKSGKRIFEQKLIRG